MRTKNEYKLIEIFQIIMRVVSFIEVIIALIKYLFRSCEYAISL